MNKLNLLLENIIPLKTIINTQSNINFLKINNNKKFKIESKIDFKISNLIIKKEIKEYDGCDKIGDKFDHFFREIKSLEQLKKYNNFPKIISFDGKKHIIYLNYCGELINKNNIPSNWKYQLENINKTLIKNNIFHNDIWYGNFLIKDGIIHLIDFGWSTHYYQDYPYMNLLYTDTKNYDNIYLYLDRIFEKAVKNRFEKFPNLHLTYNRPNLFIDYNK
jgi:thiamine kinase-like enzyme